MAPPPRRIGPALWLRVACGGKLTQFAALWSGFALVMMFLWSIVTESPFSPYDENRSGVVDAIRDTGSTHHDHRLYAVDFHFADDHGIARHATSYTIDPPARPGSPVSVEVVRDEPWRARIDGMDVHKSSAPWYFGLLLLPFVGIGAYLWRSRIREARLALDLLRDGLYTRGKVLAKKPTGLTYSDLGGEYKEYEVEVEFRDDRDSLHRAKVKTLHPELLEDDALEPIVYDPDQPSRATTLDHLPGRPVIEPDGSLVARSGFPYHLAILPAVCVLAPAGTVVMLALRIALGWTPLA
jgi:hypothetical protein